MFTMGIAPPPPTAPHGATAPANLADHIKVFCAKYSVLV